MNSHNPSARFFASQEAAAASIMMSAGEPARVAAPAVPTTTTCVDLYVVQKCWFAGPVVTPAVDYLRLLTTAKDAEQVAYQSAHLYNNNNNSVRTNNNNNNNHSRGGGVGPVRTIQLPHTHHYGFVAAGQLFWVRSVKATSTVPLVVSPTREGWKNFGEAHCIVTGGLLGGNGDNASLRRRGFESSSSSSPSETAASSRVFVGPHSSHAALQLVTAPTGSAVVEAGSTVQWVPVGQPASVEQLTREWPDSATWNHQHQHNQHHHNYATTTTTATLGRTVEDVGMEDDAPSSSSSLLSTKRVVLDEENSWFNGGGYGGARGVAEKEHRMMMDSSSPLSRPTKRPCRTTSATHAAFLNRLQQHGVVTPHSNMEH